MQHAGLSERRGALVEVQDLQSVPLMTTPDQQRAFVAEISSKPEWKKKVKKMSDSQITAIYLREIAQHGTKPHKPKPKSEPENKESGEDDIPF